MLWERLGRAGKQGRHEAGAVGETALGRDQESFLEAVSKHYKLVCEVEPSSSLVQMIPLEVHTFYTNKELLVRIEHHRLASWC